MLETRTLVILNRVSKRKSVTNAKEVHLFHDAALHYTDDFTKACLLGKQCLSASLNTENLKSVSTEAKEMLRPLQPVIQDAVLIYCSTKA